MPKWEVFGIAALRLLHYTHDISHCIHGTIGYSTHSIPHSIMRYLLTTSPCISPWVRLCIPKNITPYHFISHYPQYIHGKTHWIAHYVPSPSDSHGGFSQEKLPQTIGFSIIWKFPEMGGTTKSSIYGIFRCKPSIFGDIHIYIDISICWYTVTNN
jgi:hypothetical protein